MKFTTLSANGMHFQKNVPVRQFMFQCVVVCFLICIHAFACGNVDAETKTLEDSLKPLIADHKGQVAVAIKNLKTGESYEHRADQPMPTASLIKLPLMIATYQAIEEGKLDPTTTITLQEEDKVPGSGVLTTHFSGGLRLSLRDAIQLMIAFSDNTATNLVIDQVGLAATAEMMEKLDCPHTKLHSKVYRRDTSIFPERSQQFGLGSTTASEIVKLLEKLHARDLVSESACEKMLGHLLACDDSAKIARFLPKDTKFAHKTGAVSASRCDAGLILVKQDEPIAICVLTSKNEDQRWNDENAAELLCAQIGKATYDHFFPSESPEADSDSESLQMGASGTLVESLQRTLNARLEPSPRLSIDGDFGPLTEEAVMRFQTEQELPATGKVGPETWKALGTLVDEDSEAPAPEEVNSQKIEKQPADTLKGQPFVTCRAWGIGDGKTGKLLWGENAETPVHIASTTKVMTAYVVLTIAEEDPTVLEEIVTFSPTADEVIGSTSALRAGEQLPVKELLYGLLLPSGNDASVALAEHFGSRLGKQLEELNAEQAYKEFIKAMNRTAKEIGMKDSCFKNTHGLTTYGHFASPRDLLILARHAMQIPLFREIVGTVQHGYTVDSKSGYQRNVLWRNTNRLLRIEGYGGVKTGTTRAAGACLISYSTRDDRSLFAVVLGSSGSDARYADTRNLFRWAWNQLIETDNSE